MYNMFEKKKEILYFYHYVLYFNDDCDQTIQGIIKTGKNSPASATEKLLEQYGKSITIVLLKRIFKDKLNITEIYGKVHI